MTRRPTTAPCISRETARDCMENISGCTTSSQARRTVCATVRRMLEDAAQERRDQQQRRERGEADHEPWNWQQLGDAACEQRAEAVDDFGDGEEEADGGGGNQARVDRR